MTSILKETIEKNRGAGRVVVDVPHQSRTDLASLFYELGFTLGVEIGTERGKYAEVLLKKNPILGLYCVDPYILYDDNEGYKLDTTQSVHEYNYDEAMRRLAGLKFTIIRKTSEEAASSFQDRSLDFVYIDGNHRLDHVVKDLYLWSKKVKVGGIIAGHDYIKPKNQTFTHIPYALKAHMAAYNLNTPLFVLDQKTKDKPDELNSRLDRVRSWFYIKEDQ